MKFKCLLISRQNILIILILINIINIQLIHTQKEIFNTIALDIGNDFIKVFKFTFI